MRHAPGSDSQVDKKKTRAAVREAIGEVQHAARPERKSAPGVMSWMVALAAGAAVAWRAISAPKPGEAPEQDKAPTGLNGLSSYDPGRISKPEKSADPGVRPKDDTAARRSKNQQPDNDQSKSSSLKGRDSKDSKGDDCPAKAEGASGLAKELWCRFQSAECLTRSQALAFIGVLSLGPILLFALAALGFVIHDAAQVERFVHDLVGQLLPGRQASEAANNLIAQTHIIESAHTLMNGKWWAVAIGVISLIWAAIGLFVGASDPMNASWSVKEKRGFIKLRAIALGVFLASGVLFLLSLVPSSLPSLVGKLNLPVIGSIPPGQWWVELLAWLLAIVVDAAMFTVIYKFLPNAPVKWKSALFGGAVAGLFWELFKKGFAVYITHFGNFDKLYGALGGVVLLVTWIWYSCLLLLVGAIVCKMYQEHKLEGGVLQSRPAAK